MDEMINPNQKKIIIFIIIFIGIIISLVVNNMIFVNKKNDDFTEYQKIIINEKLLKDKEIYEEIRNQLENDFLFSKITMTSNYNYKNFSKKDLRSMIKNFVFAYSSDNEDKFDALNNYEGLKCLKKQKIFNAFSELYNVDISEYIDFAMQYEDIIIKSNNLYCIYFDNIVEEFDNEIKVGIDSITVNDDIITIKMYIYDYYTDYLDYELINIATLERYIDEKQFVKAAEHVDDLMNGNVSKKEIKFMINDNPEYFIYKILEIHEI